MAAKHGMENAWQRLAIGSRAKGVCELQPQIETTVLHRLCRSLPWWCLRSSVLDRIHSPATRSPSRRPSSNSTQPRHSATRTRYGISSIRSCRLGTLPRRSVYPPRTRPSSSASSAPFFLRPTDKLPSLSCLQGVKGSHSFYLGVPRYATPSLHETSLQPQLGLEHLPLGLLPVWSGPTHLTARGSPEHQAHPRESQGKLMMA